MFTLEQMQQLEKLLDKKFEERFAEQNARIGRKLEVQYDDLAGMMARGLTELGDTLRAEWKADIAELSDKVERKFQIVFRSLITIEENYVTKDDLMALTENFEARFVLKS